MAILDNMRQMPVNVVKYVEKARKMPMVICPFNASQPPIATLATNARFGSSASVGKNFAC